MEVMTLERTLTELDHVRLLNLMRREAHAEGAFPAADVMNDVLADCHVVPSRDVDPDVVTMGSKLVLHEPQTGQQTLMTLCYPADAEPAVGRVSVLSPVGSALLGLRIGSTARWLTPDGEPKAAYLMAILFQPESNGDYAM